MFTQLYEILHPAEAGFRMTWIQRIAEQLQSIFDKLCVSVSLWL